MPLRNLIYIARQLEAYEMRTNEPELELKVLMLNLNTRHNKELLERCRTLKEYCLFVERVRRYAADDVIQEAVERAVSECIREGILSDFLQKQRAEVIAMSIFEYNEEEELKKIRADEYELGKLEGERVGRIAGIIELLSALGEIPTDMRQVIEQEGDPERLTELLKAAARVSRSKSLKRRWVQKWNNAII